MAQPVRFEGTIGRTVAESEPWFAEPAHPGEDAPSVMIVLLDDTGFAQLGCFGYATFAVGKWHLAPMEQCSAAGPFDQWPLARGFQRFYGFLEGETDQFHPELVADNHPIEAPGGPEGGYHLSHDLVDRALVMIADSTGVRPDRPFFCYLAFGATSHRIKRRARTSTRTAGASTRAGT